MKLYMLDTNAVSHSLRGFPPGVKLQMGLIPAPQIVISAITEAELLYGLARRPDAHNLRRMVEMFLRETRSLPWTSAAARVFAEMKAELERRGKPMGMADAMIAAHAIAENAALVTNDAAFERVNGLRVEDWTR